jgi:hypothetical protein
MGYGVAGVGDLTMAPKLVQNAWKVVSRKNAKDGELGGSYTNNHEFPSLHASEIKQRLAKLEGLVPKLKLNIAKLMEIAKYQGKRDFYSVAL